MSNAQVYEPIGATDGVKRREGADRRKDLGVRSGMGRTVLNVGAGTGSYALRP